MKVRYIVATATDKKPKQSKIIHFEKAKLPNNKVCLKGYEQVVLNHSAN